MDDARAAQFGAGGRVGGSTPLRAVLWVHPLAGRAEPGRSRHGRVVGRWPVVDLAGEELDDAPAAGSLVLFLVLHPTRLVDAVLLAARRRPRRRDAAGERLQ